MGYVTRSKTPSIAELQAKPFIKIGLRELLTNKSLYHGKYVETEGSCSSNFERSALYYDTIFKQIDGGIKYRMYGDALWVDFHPAYIYHRDSLQHKIIRVRGYFDSSIHYDSYSGELLNTYHVDLLQNDLNHN